MPEDKGEPMPTADMHGGKVAFEDRDGNPVSFEVVRLGTLAELATVKGALKSKGEECAVAIAASNDSQVKMASTAEKLEAADAAYRTEKLANEAFRTTTSELRGQLSAAQESLEVKNGALDQRTADVDSLIAQRDSARAELAEAHKANDLAGEHWREEKAISAQLRKDNASIEEVSGEQMTELRNQLEAATSQLDARRDENAALTKEVVAANAETAAKQTEIGELRAEIGRKDAELENLMTVKASLEETETALAVKDKELCEERESHTATMANHDHYRKERDVSNATLAELKAELLAEGDRFKTILDVMAEKISGE